MKTVDSTSTKDEEIKHLHTVASTCKPGSYLADLFTPLLIARVEIAIMNDTPPDILGELEAKITHGITKDTEHQREIDNLKIDAQRARETTRHYQLEAEGLRNRWSDLVHERAELLGTIARLTRELETIKAQAEAFQI